MISNEEKAARYLAKFPTYQEGQGHNQTFKAACRLVHDFALSPASALSVLQDWNQTHFGGRWTEKELRHKIDQAMKATNHGKPFGNKAWDAKAAQPQAKATVWGKLGDQPPTEPTERLVRCLDCFQPERCRIHIVEQRPMDVAMPCEGYVPPDINRKYAGNMKETAR